ncbi:MAG TPA: TlpA disulfide reductase family protein [Gemmatimonadota bacterium]|nr:TlpA disulfide reductase family protein [Gemmatimonadota bacterium]
MERSMNRRLQRGRRLLTHGALIGAGILLVLLGFEHRALDADFRDYRERQKRPHAGEYVPPFHGETLEGDEVTLGPGMAAERQVLFVFNTTCRFCIASLPAWEDIAVRLGNSGNVRAYGVSYDPLEETSAYVTRHAISFPVLAVEAPRFLSYYRTRAVPLTLVIDSAGYVLYGRNGTLLQGTAALDSVLTAALAPDQQARF